MQLSLCMQCFLSLYIFTRLASNLQIETCKEAATDARDKITAILSQDVSSPACGRGQLPLFYMLSCLQKKIAAVVQMSHAT